MDSPLRPLILLPGLLNDRRLWQHQVPLLSAKAEMLIPEYGLDDSLDIIADKVLSQAQPVFALAGFSMGGYVAMEILRRAPQRVSGLALISTTAGIDKPEQRDMRRKTMDLVQTGGFDQIVDNAIAAALYPKGAALVESQLLMRQMADAVGPHKFCAHIKAVMNRRGSESLLAQIDAPCLVAVGARDRITPPAWSRSMAAKIPGARLECIDGSGHMLPLQGMIALNQALLAWLDNI